MISKIIYNCRDCFLKNDLIELAILKGLQVYKDTPKFILESRYYLEKIIMNSNDINAIFSAIDYFKSDLLTDDIINLAIEKGYYITNESPKVIRSSFDYVNKIITQSNDVDIINSTMDFCDRSLLNGDLFRLAIKKGFHICDRFFLTEDRLLIYANILNDNYNLIEEMLIHNLDNFSIVAGIVHNCFKFIDKKDYLKRIFLFLKKNNFNSKINFETIIQVSFKNKGIIEFFMEYSSELYKNNIYGIIKELNNEFIVYLEMENLFAEEMFNYFTSVELVKIYKYLFLINKKINFKAIIDDRMLSKFVEGYNILYGKFDVEDLYEYYQLFVFHKNIICNIEFSCVPTKEIKTLKKLLKSKYDLQGLKTDNINESFIRYIYKYNKENMNSIDELKNTISYLLFDKNFEQMNNFCKRILSSNKAILLAYYVEDENIKYILKKYSIILRYFEDKVLNNNNYDSLFKIANKLNNLFIVDNSFFEDLINLVSNIEKKILTIYGNELKSNLCEVIPAENSNSEKFYSSNEELGTKGVEVNYIQYSDEKYFLQHIMNRFCTGRVFGEITDWKNPRLVGKTYICLSLIFNEIESNFSYGLIPSVNTVTLLFNDFVSSNLKMFSSCDLGSFAPSNCNEIDYANWKVDCFPTKIIADKIKNNSLCEYIMLRENPDGSILYPCGVKVVGDMPTKEEIDAAAYLGIPLIKLQKTRKKKKENIAEIKKSMDNYRFNADENKVLETFESNLSILFNQEKAFERKR